ncbi:DEAD/DEAH box helicase [Bacillus sp. 2205SS5-2]|uniref:DEAD/DEAH box helicase n=1 Tax=Bacillus sp. 2205SS5-2 TaxID=3109031 RepID=UPI0030058AB9
MVSTSARMEAKSLFTSANYRKGNNYYRQGRVKEIVYNQIREAWYAKVRGTRQYQVIISENEKGFEFECNCPAFDRYDQECKHVVAAFLELQEKESKSVSIPSTREQKKIAEDESTKQMGVKQSPILKNLTNQFIHRFAEYQEETISSADLFEKKLLQVEWSCQKNTHYIHSKQFLSIEMKVGHKRTYVVKNIKEFLAAIKQKIQYPFTKNFTYDPTEFSFTKEDQDMIDLLQESIKFEEMYHHMQSSYYSTNYSVEGRSMKIAPLIADQLLEKLAERQVQFQNDRDFFQKLNFYPDEYPFTMLLEKGNRYRNTFQLNIGDFLDVEYLELYGYAVKKNDLYKLSATQQTLFQELMKIIQYSNNPVIPISHDQIEPMLSYVAPIINEVGELKIADSISSKILNKPLHAKMYVDFIDDVLKVDLDYQYGEVTINPFQHGVMKSADAPIIMRDTETENVIMNIIESSSLKSNGQLIYLEGEEDIFSFLYSILPKLEDKVDIFLTEKVKSFLLPKQQSPVTNIDVDSSGNWLDVRFTMEGIEQEDIRSILSDVVEKKKYYRLPSGVFVSLESEEFQKIHHLFDEFNLKPSQLNQASLRLPLYRGMQLGEMVDRGSQAKFGKQFRQLLKRMKNPEELDFDVPDTLRAELRDYQNYGFQWLSTLHYYRLGGILADDMGLGKTLQSIALLLAEKERSEDSKPALIIAPASLVYNWKNELEKFSPTLRSEVMIGSPQERMEKLNASNQADVWITSYPTLRQDIEEYGKHEFQTLILDEAQAVKNYATKTAKAVREIKAGTRFALSGTPIENSVDELWSIMQTIIPDFFPNQKAFRQLPPEKLAKMIHPFLLRRMKKDVLTELPDKIESVQVSELSKKQKELYLAYLNKIKTETQDAIQGEGFQKSRIKILAGLTRLRQLCCHPSLFLEDYHGGSGKLQQLIEVVENARENGRRMLIFSQFTSMLSLIRNSLEEVGLSCFYLDGQTPSKERVQLVDRFNEGEADIFLISLKAGNTGLNLTGADTVILYDLWWNPAVEEQAAGRAHRMGQKNVVQVIRLITQGTIEEKIYELQQTKKELIESVIDQGDQTKTRLTEADIKEILEL